MSTIKDVAKAAQVSVSTASRALNDNPRISAATIAKVKQVAAALDYRPSGPAKTLSKGEASVVGVIFPVTDEHAPANPFQLDIIRGANTELVAKNYVLATAICQDEASLLKNVQAMVEQSQIHNFLVLYTKADDPVTAYLREKAQNFVIIGHPSQPGDRYLNNDNQLAGQKATHHLLIEEGVRQPLLVCSGHHWAYEADRQAGYQAALAAQGGTALSYDLQKDEPAAFFAAHPSVDGIIAVDDISLLSFYNQLQTVTWPKQLPAICFNRSRLLSLASPAVIKVDMMPRQLGAKAINLLFDKHQTHQLVGFRIVSANEK